MKPAPPKPPPVPDYPGQPEERTNPGFRPDLLRYAARANEHADQVASAKAEEVKGELEPLISKHWSTIKVLIAAGGAATTIFTAGMGTVVWSQTQADKSADRKVANLQQQVNDLKDGLARSNLNQKEDFAYVVKKLERIEELSEYKVPPAARPPPVPEPPPRDGGR